VVCKQLLLFTVVLCSALALRAQTVNLTGRVWNKETNTPLPGISVVLMESGATAGKGTGTDVEGRFFLPVVKGRTYDLRFSGVGFVTRTIKDIMAGADLQPIDVLLESNRKTLEQVVVSANSRKASVASLYSIQKNSSAISDGISADVIRRSPDRNTGDVLKRVSGASVQENRFVVIRGMNERYNTSLLNNTPLPSTEADKKAFAFNIIPASLVDNIVIYKAATPDLPGDFSGGAVKVQTRDFPAQQISELSVSIGYNTRTTGKNFYKGRPDGKWDGLGFLDNSRLIPGPYYRQRGADFINNSPEYKQAVTKLFPNTYGYAPAQTSLPSISASYTGGNTKLYDNGSKLGYIYSAGYSNGRSVSDRTREEYEANRILLYGFHTNNYDDKNSLNALLSLSLSYRHSKISWKNLFNNEFVKTTAPRTGYNLVNTPDIFYTKSINTEVSQNGLVNSVVEGLHQLGTKWTVNWSGGFGYTYRNQPDQKILSFRSADNKDADYSISIANENSPAIRTTGRIYSFLRENIYNGSVNASKAFNWWGLSQKLQLGTMNYYRDRNVEVDALGYATLGDRTIDIHESKDVTFETIFDPANIDQYKLTVANISANSAEYSGHALLNAGYVLLDNKFSDRLKMVWGVRVEKYRQELIIPGRAHLVKDNTDLLPSLLLTYALTGKTNLRLSGSRAVNRPEFRELADYGVYDYDNFFSVIGNPDLKRARNTNGDLRLEYFPQAGEILSTSVFYKHFTDPIERTNMGNDVLSYENADNAYIYGIEAEIRKKLDFPGNGFLSNLTVYANAAYMKGGVKFGGVETKSPMQGQSPYLLNGGVTWLSPKEDWSVNLLYNRVGPRLQFRAKKGASALNIFERPRNMLDAQISRKFLGGKLEVKLTVSDILAPAFQWYYKYDASAGHTGYDAVKDRIITSIRSGTTATLGLKVNL
jgi:TonB-dependent receptor